MFERLFLLIAGALAAWAFSTGAVGCSVIQNGLSCTYNPVSFRASDPPRVNTRDSAWNDPVPLRRAP